MEVGRQCHALATVLQEDWYTSCMGCGARCSVLMGVENLRDVSLFVIILNDDCRSLSMWPHNVICSTCVATWLAYYTVSVGAGVFDLWTFCSGNHEPPFWSHFWWHLTDHTHTSSLCHFCQWMNLSLLFCSCSSSIATLGGKHRASRKHCCERHSSLDWVLWCICVCVCVYIYIYI